MSRYPPELVAVFLLVGACGVLFLVAYWRAWSPRLWVSVVTGLAIRVAVVGLSRGHTPMDVTTYFYNAGLAVLHGRNPMTALPRFRWNFLPMMPYLFAIEIKTGLSWQIAGKIVPTLADVVCIVLLAALAKPANARLVPLLYALCPVAILVTAVHGQVEPFVLALGLGALLLVRHRRVGGAGLLTGLAVAAKTWPLLLSLGLLRDTAPRQWWKVIVGAAVAPIAMLLSVPLFLHDSIGNALRALTSYRSFLGEWGWSGVLHTFGVVGKGYSGASIESFQTIGTVLALITVVAVIIYFRKLDGAAITAAILLGFISVTAGFGVQYLLWPVPFVLLLCRRQGIVYIAFASIYAAYDYLFAIPGIPRQTGGRIGALMAFSLIVIAVAIWAMPWTVGRIRAGEQQRCS